jgi:hypothetical protein
MALHSLQFVIVRGSVAPIAGWKSLEIDGGRWLHCCSALPTSLAVTTDRKRALLLGWAFQLASDESAPQNQLSALASNELPDSYRTWTGRWLLVLGDRVHGDATCSIPIFFGKGVVSSSLSLIREMTGAEWKQHHQLIYGFGVDWYPAPITPLDGIARLLPSQVLSLTGLTVEHRTLMGRIPDQNPVQSFQEALVNGMDRLRGWPAPVFLSLTGGFDSRTVLASAHTAGLRPITYTQEHPWLSHGDRKLPPRIARELGLLHAFIPPQARSPEKEAIFDKHTMAQCIDADRSFYSHGQWDAFPPDSLVLRGLCFEFGRGTLYRKIPEDFDPGMPGAAERLHRYYILYHHHPLHRISRQLVEKACRRQPFITEALHAYLAWASRHPESGLDFRDQFHLEQRPGCWVGTTEQGLDVTATVRVSVGNSHRILSLMNQASVSERRAGVYQKTAIAALAPALASFPFNPIPRWARIRRKVTQKTRKALLVARFLADKPVQRHAIS